jgi:hypothetical protein
MKRPDIENLLEEARTLLTTVLLLLVIVGLVILCFYWLDADIVRPLLFPAGKPWQK